MKLDLGCGKNKQPDCEGVDVIAFDGVDHVLDLRKLWPWADSSIEAVHCSHFVEHLTGSERIHFINELYRVLIPDGKATIVVPHWASCRAYGDMTHQWPPVSEFWFYYLSKKWRATDNNAPHDDIQFNPKGYDCDFEATWGYSLHPSLSTRNQEFQQFYIQWNKESILDIIATLTAKK